MITVSCGSVLRVTSIGALSLVCVCFHGISAAAFWDAC